MEKEVNKISFKDVFKVQSDDKFQKGDLVKISKKEFNKFLEYLKLNKKDNIPGLINLKDMVDREYIAVINSAGNEPEIIFENGVKTKIHNVFLEKTDEFCPPCSKCGRPTHSPRPDRHYEWLCETCFVNVNATDINLTSTEMKLKIPWKRIIWIGIISAAIFFVLFKFGIIG